MKRKTFDVRGNYIHGEFHTPQDPLGQWESISPADSTDRLGKFSYAYSGVDAAVTAAKEAFASWKKTSLADRSVLLQNYREQLKKQESDLAEAIAREVGKPLWEAQSEVATMINKVEVTLNEGMKWIKDYEIPNILSNTEGVCRYKPHGVMAVIGPFNFPGHLPNGHIVPALLTGNTVVFKPSEKAPLVGQLMAECFHAAGFPPGVFNLIQGEAQVSQRLCVHEAVSGVLFTGSYDVGLRLKQETLHQFWKILALEMGGKNGAIVWDDCKLDLAIYELLLGVFLTTGQRCSATSRIFVSRKILPAFVERFHQCAKAFKIGHPLDNPFMGPLIDSEAVDRYLKFIGIAQREGCEILMRGKQLEVRDYIGYYVTPTIAVTDRLSVAQIKKSVYQQTEIFAPNVVVVGVDDWDEAIQLANATQFGLVASVFTESQERYLHCVEDLEVGLINWNKSTVGASSRLPFGGLKKSGNHFPTAILATQYCTYPVASLENRTQFFSKEIAAHPPGLNFR
jgi:succinylglutamic semialdehyde dehydrogenase